MTEYERMYYEYKRIKYENILKELKKSIDKQNKVCYNKYIR
jgi:hypothetical protein